MHPSDPKHRPWRATLALAALLAAPALPAPPAWGQSPAPVTVAAPGAQAISLEVGSGRSVPLPQPAATLFVASPDIADVQAPAQARSFFVTAKKPGRTTIYALDGSGRQIAALEVSVSQPLSAIRQHLSRAFPDLKAEVESTPAGLVVSGSVTNPMEAAATVEAVRQFVGEAQPVVNRLAVTGSTQVNLRVRVAEVSRTVTEELGFNWESFFSFGNFSFGIATGRDALSGDTILRAASGAAAIPLGYRNGNVDVNAIVDALARDGLVTILAEPNLTAVSGETASFLAGGEFPIPVSRRDDEITIEFKKFGVSLDFTPTVMSGGRISMRVRPEVSELTDEGAVNIRNLVIPALSVRRAETTVELGSGQSFAIAGLLQDNTRNTVDQVPGLGKIPVLGALFSSSRFQREETELVIVVTPYLVRPTGGPASLRLPTDGYAPPTDLERIFLNRLNRPGQPLVGPGGARLSGDAGFILE